MSQLQHEAENSALEMAFSDFSPDLVVTNSAINCLPALVARRRKIPVWWYIHEVIPKSDQTGPLLSMITSHADQILVPSRHVQRSICHSEQQTTSVSLLPYGVEIPSSTAVRKNRKKVRGINGWTDSTIVIGWFGSIYHGKGLIEVIRACAVLKCYEKKLVLLVAGNIGDQDYFRGCMEEAANIPSVVFHYMGVLEKPDDLLSAVDLVAVPSLVEEGFPNVALEAMAYGKCIVAYKSGGLQEIVIDGKTGKLVERGDTASFASAMGEIVNETKKRQLMAKHARMRAIRQHRYELFAKSIKKLMDENVKK